MAKKKTLNLKPHNRLKKQQIIQLIENLFNSNPKESFDYEQVVSFANIPSQSAEKQMMSSIFKTLLSKGFLVQDGLKKYKLNHVDNIAEGIFERCSNGKNLVTLDNGEKSILVAKHNSLHAMNKDRVRVRIFTKWKGHNPEGEVIGIIQRQQDTVVGILEVSKYYAYLIVDNKICATDIFIPKDKTKDGKTGQKAVVRIVEWPVETRKPIGEVIDILGDIGNQHTEMHAILAEFGLPYKYPKTVERAAKKIHSQITQKDIDAREDFRDKITFTIDPKDAKDFDDALSLRHLPNGTWEVGVHIADVTHYIKQNSLIDREAAKRATSIYLVDRTIPMLPELLSNNLCSLRPQEDKLCFSIIFEINDAAEIKSHRIKRTIINSNQRLNYEEAQKIIEGRNAGNEVEKAILTLDRLARIFRKERFASGSINFDRAEMQFDIDENGKPLRIFYKKEQDANRLVEEFMLLANKTVAEFIGKKPKGTKAKTFVYRVHDLPNYDKMANFSKFVRQLGYKMKEWSENSDISKSINNLLKQIQGRPEQNLIETIAIRTMAKATYTTVNIGHYGLAFKYYTHFTSPIRRYPDIMAHRLLERYLAGGRSACVEKIEDYCKHCSIMEGLAVQAERASIKYKQVEFMSDKTERVFNGVISGVTEWGLFVELNENSCEGMIPMRELNGDFYEFDEKTYSLIGKRTKHRYRVGDPLQIRVVRANLEKRQLDFTPENGKGAV